MYLIPLSLIARDVTLLNMYNCICKMHIAYLHKVELMNMQFLTFIELFLNAYATTINALVIMFSTFIYMH